MAGLDTSCLLVKGKLTQGKGNHSRKIEDHRALSECLSRQYLGIATGNTGRSKKETDSNKARGQMRKVLRTRRRYRYKANVSDCYSNQINLISAERSMENNCNIHVAVFENSRAFLILTVQLIKLLNL